MNTEGYSGGPLGAPPASGSLGIAFGVSPGVSSFSSLTIGNQDSPATPGTYYGEVRHTKPGFPSSVFAAMASVEVP